MGLYKQLTEPYRTNEGDIIGEIQKTCTGKIYKAFSGIPYAKPPTGSLRFQPPVKAETRSKDYIATKKGIKGCQGKGRSYTGHEDCLYLNIYVPNQNDDTTGTLPVMVYFHGGGFTSGDGGTTVYGPDYIIDHEVILVTINYRLGVFGFLTLASDIAPGNLGLRDQQLALKWVKDNIEYFGGNGNLVTIFGQSAGAMSCMYHLISPKSDGLFDQIIGQSGVFWNYYRLKTFNPDNARCLAERLGFSCDGKSDEQILEFLQKEDARKLHNKSLSFGKDDSFTIQKYAPCVDDFCENPLLPKDGYTLLKEGNYNKVPIILGTCKDEGLFLSYNYKAKQDGFRKMDDDWHNIGPLELFGLPYHVENEKLVDLAERVRKFYFGDESFGFENYDLHSKMIGDIWFDSQCHHACSILSNTSDKPVYKYRFDHEGKHSVLSYTYFSNLKFYSKLALKLITGLDVFDKFRPGVNHGDDLNFIFRMLCFNADEVDSDRKVKAHITKLWTNFAKYGKPTEDDNDWSEFSQSEQYRQYVINTNPGMTDYEMNYKERINFWMNDIIPGLRSQGWDNAL